MLYPFRIVGESFSIKVYPFRIVGESRKPPDYYPFRIVDLCLTTIHFGIKPFLHRACHFAALDPEIIRSPFLPLVAILVDARDLAFCTARNTPYKAVPNEFRQIPVKVG